MRGTAKTAAALAVAVGFVLAGLAGPGCGGAAECDIHEDCAADEVCLFGDAPRCAPACAREDGACPSGLVCDECATASCPLCQDCVPACVLPD